MIATFNQAKAVLWLPPLKNTPRLCSMIATFNNQTEAVLWLPPLKNETEAVLWFPPLKNKPRLCYDCHL